MGCGKSLLRSLRPTLENLSLSPHWDQPRQWEPQLPAVCSAVGRLLPSYRICLFACLFSVSLSFSLSVSLSPSLSLFFSLCLRLHVTTVSCSQMVSDSLSVLCLCLSLRPSSWLLTKATGPTLHAWINLSISLSPWGEGQEEQAQGRHPSSMKEGNFKPERPGQAKAKNFSLTRRAGYLVRVGEGRWQPAWSSRACKSSPITVPQRHEVPFSVPALSASMPQGEADQ